MARCISACSRARPASTHTQRPCPTFIRTCSRRAPTAARAFTMWMPSRRRSQAVSRKARFSATTYWRVFLPARGWSPMSKSLKIFRRVTTLPHPVSTDGRAVTGSCCLGPLVAGRRPAAVDGRTFRRWAAGSSSTTFAALCRPRASFLALLTGWILLPPAAASLWCGFVLLPFLLTAFLPLVTRVIPRRSGITTGSHFRAFRLDLRVAVLQFCLQVALLAHQAWLMGDAIARTLSRLYRRRGLLEWLTAAAAGADRELKLVGFYRRMAGAVALAVCGALAVAYADHDAW